MKKIVLMMLVASVVMLTSCGVIAEAKVNANQMNYQSITGEKGMLILHTPAGDKVIPEAEITYCGTDNDDLFYKINGKRYYYSGPCSLAY